MVVQGAAVGRRARLLTRRGVVAGLGQALQDAALLGRALGTAGLAQGLEVFLERAQLADALRDMADVGVEQRVDIAAVGAGLVAFGLLASFRNLQRARGRGQADMVRLRERLIDRRPGAGRDVMRSLIQTGGSSFLLGLLCRLSLPVADLETRRAGLEEVFLQITRDVPANGGEA